MAPKATEAPTLELVLKRNSVERLKHELFPTELANQWDRVAGTSYERLPEEDIVRLQWFGLYHDKPKIGGFMMRVKIPSGILTAEGLRTIGEISRRRRMLISMITPQRTRRSARTAMTRKTSL